MKILILQDRLRSGGTERQSILLSGALAAAGHTTTLLTFRPGGALSAAAGVESQSLQPFDCHLDWFAPGLFRHVRRFEPEILLAMGRMANCWSGALQQRFPRTAVVATLRTGKPLPWLFRRSLRRVRHIVANCREAMDLVAERHEVPREKMSVIYNPLVFEPTASPAPASEALRARFGAGPATSVLLSVAMFRPEKGQSELIEAVGALPLELNWQLWLAGDGPTRPACQRLVEQSGLGDRVKFAGFCADPGALYAAANFAVHMSRSESLSNFLIEAQSQGLPAVASEAQGVRECVVPGRTGFVVERGDHAAFRAALVQLMGEPEPVRAIRAAEARIFARATFDPTRQVANYLELFEKLAGLGG